MFERFTDATRRVVVHAQDEARGFGHTYIGSERLLLGLLGEETGLAATALASLGVKLDAVRARVGEAVDRGVGTDAGFLPFTPQAKAVLNNALEEALALGHNYIGTEHVLLGLARDDAGTATRILDELGADPATIIDAVLRGVNPPTSPKAMAASGTEPHARGGEEPPTRSPGQERFTEPARKVVVLAEQEARALSHNYVGTEHILLGLLREEESLAARVLDTLDITVEEVRLQVARIVGQGDRATTGQIPFTPRTKKVLELAWREALSLGHNRISTEHILLGLVRENEGIAARILNDFDADAGTIRTEILRMLSGPGRRSAPSTRSTRTSFSITADEQAGSGAGQADRAQLVVACPACATPIETVTVNERNALLQVTMHGVQTCSGCGMPWLISINATWRDPAPPSHPEGDLGSRLTIWRHTERAHFTMACFRCHLDLERVTLKHTTPPITTEAEGERTCPSCDKHWHIAYSATWEEPRGDEA
jgi:ATP-dependent Clp protease ATP-binding subunit ClpA